MDAGIHVDDVDDVDVWKEEVLQVSMLKMGVIGEIRCSICMRAERQRVCLLTYEVCTRPAEPSGRQR